MNGIIFVYGNQVEIMRLLSTTACPLSCLTMRISRQVPWSPRCAAVARPARPLTAFMSITGGAAIDGQGFFYPPTILAVRPMPRRLGNQLGIFCQRTHATNDMSVFHQNNLMEVFFNDGKRLLSQHTKPQPVCNRVQQRKGGSLLVLIQLWLYLAVNAGTTPMTRTDGMVSLIAVAIPEISPAAADRDDDRINVG